MTFILVISEASIRYIGTSKYLTTLCLTFPIAMFIIFYLIFYKVTRNVKIYQKYLINSFLTKFLYISAIFFFNYVLSL